MAVLLQGGVVVGGQLRGQRGIQRGAFLGWAARNRLGRKFPGFAALPQIPFDRGQGHLEHLHNVGARGAMIDRVEDALAEVG